MNKENLEEIKKLLSFLKRGNLVWPNSSSVQKAKMLDKCQWIFDRLVELGCKPGFGEGCLMYGKEFTDTLERENKPEPKFTQNNTVMDAQRVFGVRATRATYGEIEAAKMAEEMGALVYEIEGYEKGEDGAFHPKLKVLTYKADTKRA